MNELTITSPCDGLALSCLYVEPSGEPRGVVQISHGMCEHKERYVPFMEFLVQNGFACVINDHRGHGASVRKAEDLGYMYKKGWLSMVLDTKAVTDWAKEKWPGKPLTLLGHSMGSMVVRSYLKRFDDSIDALIVSGCPSDNPAKGAGKALAAILGTVCGWHFRPSLLQKMSFGAYNKEFVSEGWPSAWVCSDKTVLEAYHKDPLCQYVFTANGFYNLLALMQDCYGAKGWKTANTSLPVSFLSGAQDPCRVSDEALSKAADCVRAAGYGNVSVKLYPDMRHEILNETDRMTVWSDILALLAV